MCNCKAKFEGRACDICQDGFYKMQGDCVPCDCDVDYSDNSGISYEGKDAIIEFFPGRDPYNSFLPNKS